MANNVKTLQNALKWLERRIREEVKLDGCTSVDHAVPLRQCDVGTAEEQSERMEKAVCSKHHGCVRCPLRKAKYSDCSLGWAQMPYEEGGAK